MNDSLSPSAPDYVAAALKSSLGAVPVAGSLLVELVGAVIPNQRIDRIADFAKKLEHQMQEADRAALRDRLTNENFTDLLEESVRQAARAVTEERRAYLASLIAAGVTEERASFVESKHLLRLLGEINDLEIIWLRFYLCPLLDGDHAFREKHAATLKPIAVTLDVVDQRTHDRQALQQNYLQHLVSLGLLQQPLYVGHKTGQPKLDRATRGWVTTGHELTGLGGLLLRHIGLDDVPET